MSKNTYSNKKLVSILPSILVLSAIWIFPLITHAEEASVTTQSRATEKIKLENKEFKKSGTNPSGLNVTLQKKLELREQLKEKVGEVKCTTREKRIQNKIDMFKKSEKFHQEKFTRIYERVSQFAQKLEDQGTDVSKLNADLATLKEKIEALSDKHTELITALENLKSIECTDTDKLNNSLKEVKTIIEEVRKATEDIRSFMVNTIKPDLADLKDEAKAVREKKSEQETNSDSEDQN